ncbi:hypothetical protein TWF718_008310 [Orbilia javanica]|uniref:BTB domain-containing protein n=1 Tax=Orbilia javanica TaxID=47235 RepID=A0AAN8N506_9PEZI
MGGAPAPSLADFIFDIPFAAELGISREETEKFEEMIYSYYEHRYTPDEDIYANSIIQYLKDLNDPPQCVSNFMEMLVEAGVLELEDFSLKPSHDVKEPRLELLQSLELGQPPQPSPDQQLGDLEEHLLGLDSDMGEDESLDKDESLDEDLYFGGLRSNGFKLQLAPRYSPSHTDFIIQAGSGSELCAFRVDSQWLKETSPFFNMLLQNGQCGSPPLYSYLSDEHPVTMDVYLAYLYGLPFKLSLLRNGPGHDVSLVHGLVKLAMNTQYEGLMEDITKELGCSFAQCAWGPDLLPCLVDLYRYHYSCPRDEDDNDSIKITVPQLVEWIGHLQAGRELIQLQQLISDARQAELDSGPAIFLRDISMALCTALHAATAE